MGQSLLLNIVDFGIGKKYTPGCCMCAYHNYCWAMCHICG